MGQIPRTRQTHLTAPEARVSSLCFKKILRGFQCSQSGLCQKLVLATDQCHLSCVAHELSMGCLFPHGWMCEKFVCPWSSTELQPLLFVYMLSVASTHLSGRVISGDRVCAAHNSYTLRTHREGLPSLPVSHLSLELCEDQCSLGNP